MRLIRPALLATLRICVSGVLLAGPGGTISAIAQTPDAMPASLGSTIDRDLIEDLPVGDNLFLLLETTQPPLITDRFFGGGLYAGQSGRVGGFLSSPAQTLFRIGDVALDDPTGSGTPLLFPSLSLWDAVNIESGMLGSEVDAPGLAISLQPRRPAAAWSRTIDVSSSHFGTSPAPTGPLPIARLQGLDRATILASGPLIQDRLGLTAAGSWIRGSQFERPGPEAVSSDTTSAFGYLVFTPTLRDEIRTIGWIQQETRPFQHRTPFGQPAATIGGGSGHAQSTWDHGGAGDLPLRFFASYSRRRLTPAFDPATGATFERLADGPVDALAGVATVSVHRWSIGGRAGGPLNGAAPKRHSLQVGIDAEGAGSRATSFFSGNVLELVDARPARLWRFRNPQLDSFRHQIGLTAFVQDRLAITRRLFLEGGIRYESVSAAADGSESSIHWRTLMPRGAVRWVASDTWQPTMFAAYAQSAYRLPLDWLAIGEPAAPTAEVFRAGPSGSAISPLVARMGPGSGGSADFSSIDPGIRRPRSEEFVLGLNLRPAPVVRLRFAGVTKRESYTIGVLNTGPVAYEVSELFDPGGNVGSTEDDRLVPIYNRKPETFGLDRYSLTNVPLADSTFEGIELSAEIRAGRLALLLGATAGRAETSAANRGFDALENDQGIVGELGSNPNAGTFARGRPFTDRAYTGKIAGVYRFPTSTTIGLVARYQDGQPFSRMLVVTDLNQGGETIRAFASGDSRFMFTGTLDARLQQRVSIGTLPMAITVDAYNLLGLDYSVEEDVTEAPDVRVATAVQPPPSVHIGFRLTF